MWTCVNSKQIVFFKHDITFCVMPFLPEDDPKDRNWWIYLEAKKAAVPLTCAGLGGAVNKYSLLYIFCS